MLDEPERDVEPVEPWSWWDEAMGEETALRSSDAERVGTGSWSGAVRDGGRGVPPGWWFERHG